MAINKELLTHRRMLMLDINKFPVKIIIKLRSNASVFITDLVKVFFLLVDSHNTKNNDQILKWRVQVFKSG